MKRALLRFALLFCAACGGGLVDHDGVDLNSLAQLTCTAPQQACPGVATCVTLDNDPNNCGACGNVCVSPQHATGICVSRVCDLTCDSGFFRCASQLSCCPATALAAGGDTSCAVVDGTVQCWGSNAAGQLGFNPADAQWSGKPVDVPGISAASAVAVGLRHACAIVGVNGDVWCWGSNDSGQLADVTGFGPGKVTGVSNATALALGDRHSCALTGAGASAAMICWGADDVGQLGRGTPSATPRLPGPVTGISGVTSVSAGTAFSCAIGSTGGSPNLYCWGDGSLGQFGNDAAPDSATPVPVSGVSNTSKVASGDSHACAIGSGFWCWGADASGQVGDGKLSPTAKVSGPGVQSPVAVAGGSAHTCAVSISGALFCWGANESGQLGTTTLDPTRPTAVASISGIQRLALGARHSCAQAASGGVYCWGNNSNSQAGAPRGGTILSPRLIDGR
jgi:alpha-tubulin suppressor-like RCC1 family protein